MTFGKNLREANKEYHNEKMKKDILKVFPSIEKYQEILEILKRDTIDWIYKNKEEISEQLQTKEWTRTEILIRNTVNYDLFKETFSRWLYDNYGLYVDFCIDFQDYDRYEDIFHSKHTIIILKLYSD